jgi:hypothetical protein
MKDNSFGFTANCGDVLCSPILDIMPLANLVVRRRSAWEPIIRHDIMFYRRTPNP